jgi:hypothetical protein
VGRMAIQAYQYDRIKHRGKDWAAAQMITRGTIVTVHGGVIRSRFVTQWDLRAGKELRLSENRFIDDNMGKTVIEGFNEPRLGAMPHQSAIGGIELQADGGAACWVASNGSGEWPTATAPPPSRSTRPASGVYRTRQRK